jgi:hypothetical protein
MNRALAAAGLALLALPTAASAQDPGVIVDPSSPTSHEYAIPLERARGEAVGGRGPVATLRLGATGTARVQAPLFGEGIGPAAGRAQGTPPRDGGAGRLARPSTAAGANAASAPVRADGTRVLWSLLPPLAILAVGGGLGFFLARGRGSR